MSSSQLATRIISEQTSVSSEKIRRGKITNNEYESLIDIARKLQDIPLFIDETGGISMAQVTARARKLKRQNKTKKNRLAFTLCLMDSKIKNLKTGKKYPKIFGKNSLTLDYVKKLKSVPKQVYL